MYSSKMPGNWNKTLWLGTSGDTSIDSFKSSIEGKLQTNLNTNNLAIYGYSTTKVNGADYRIGDILDNGAQKARVNADGTLTKIY
jgi:hypothetical protein